MRMRVAYQVCRILSFVFVDTTALDRVHHRCLATTVSMRCTAQHRTAAYSGSVLTFELRRLFLVGTVHRNVYKWHRHFEISILFFLSADEMVLLPDTWDY
jgi:hypothetical protein